MASQLELRRPGCKVFVGRKCLFAGWLFLRDGGCADRNDDVAGIDKRFKLQANAANVTKTVSKSK